MKDLSQLKYCVDFCCADGHDLVSTCDISKRQNIDHIRIVVEAPLTQRLLSRTKPGEFLTMDSSPFPCSKLLAFCRFTPQNFTLNFKKCCPGDSEIRHAHLSSFEVRRLLVVVPTE